MPINDFFNDPIVPNPTGQSSSPSLAISASFPLNLNTEMGLIDPVDTLDSNSDSSINFSKEHVVIEFDSDSDLDRDRLPVVGHSSLAGSELQTSEPEPQTIHPVGQAIPQMGRSSGDQDSAFPSTPCLDKLKEDLQKHTKYKPNPPPLPFKVKVLSNVEELSLQHYSAWQHSGDYYKCL